MNYNVHMYAVVRIKVTDIEADNHIEAIEKAEPLAFEFAQRFLQGEADAFYFGVTEYEFAEELIYALVDEEGDEDYERSLYYDSKSGEWELSNG